MQAKEQNISPIKQRILYFAGTLGISKRDFYAKIGVSRGTLESKTGITEDVIAKFFAAYPEVSIEWLMLGVGEMLKTNHLLQHNAVAKVPVIEHKDCDLSDVKRLSDLQDTPTRPRIPLDAAAGSLSIALSSVSESDCEQIPIIPTLPKYDFTIVARGDSMTPDILSGDELACRFINEKGFIQWGRTHILDTAQGVVVKRIFDAHDSVICRSANPSYPDFNIPKSDIFHIALVVGLLRQI